MLLSTRYEINGDIARNNFNFWVIRRPYFVLQVVEELSRLGRNMSDVIKTVEWLEEKEVNVFVKNLGLQSRPNGKQNQYGR